MRRLNTVGSCSWPTRRKITTICSGVCFFPLGIPGCPSPCPNSHPQRPRLSTSGHYAFDDPPGRETRCKAGSGSSAFCGATRGRRGIPALRPRGQRCEAQRQGARSWPSQSARVREGGVLVLEHQIAIVRSNWKINILHNQRPAISPLCPGSSSPYRRALLAKCPSPIRRKGLPAP